ncbi:MAG: hypothetical protein SGJ18_03125 [Pseudomonadota bacterium]|nr:hypothetical protein [Pseudomonadota bacterium]
MLAKLLNSLEHTQKLAISAIFCVGALLPLNSQAVAKTKAKAPEWKTSLTSSNYTNTIQNSYEQIHVSGMYLLGVTRTLPSLNSLINFNGGYTLEYTHKVEDTNRNGDWNNPSFSYRYIFGDGRIFKRVTTGFDSVIPVSRGARGRSMIFGMGPMLGWGFDMGRFSLNQKLNYIYTAFTYDTSLDGRMNSPHTASFSNNLGLKFSKYWSAALVFVYVYAADYEGIATTSTNTAGSISWTIAKNFSASLGLATTSGTLTAMGDYHRLNIYDANKANAFMDLTLTF